MPDTSTQRQVLRTPPQPRMTRRRALQILIEHAARDVSGVGPSIRPGATTEEKVNVRQAITVFYRDAYGFEPSANDLRNLGLRFTD